MPPQNHQLLAQVDDLLQRGKFTDAEPLLEQFLAGSPRHPTALFLLGWVRLTTKGPSEAAEAFRRAVAAKPYFVEAQTNLAICLSKLHQHDEAVALLKQVLLLHPKNATAHLNYANALRGKGALDDAEAAYHQALALQPEFAEAFTGLAAVRMDRLQFTEALDFYRRARRLKPTLPETMVGLAHALRSLGQVEESLALFREALHASPGSDLHSDLLFTLGFSLVTLPATMLQERRNWARRYADPAAAAPAHPHDRSPDRPLRVGYVSADFRDHAATYFFEGLLAHHHPSAVQAFCYSNSPEADAVTDRLKASAHEWRDILGVGDEEVARQVQADQIDILVDLGGHTSNSRLRMFARQPAPVQVSYLGDSDTTGLTQMQYRLADAWTDPPGMTEALYTEQLVRLPRTFACYRPPVAPEVSPLPARTQGHVTFACISKLAKVHSALLDRWATILSRVPDSRFLLVAKGASVRSVQESVLSAFARRGIARERLTCIEAQPLSDYLALHGTIDILLDPFPVNGHTVTCHALWMGVPVVSQAGAKFVSRLGASVLHNLGLESLVAQTPEGYVDAAVALASDLPRLEELRRSLRPRMQQSPLMDYSTFAADVEAAYRGMWHRWIQAGA